MPAAAHGAVCEVKDGEDKGEDHAEQNRSRGFCHDGSRIAPYALPQEWVIRLVKDAEARNITLYSPSMTLRFLRCLSSPITIRISPSRMSSVPAGLTIIVGCISWEARRMARTVTP